jgi:ribonuclease HI
MVRWLPPRELYVKVNTDGASMGNEIARCEGLIRGSQGEWLGGYAKCVGVCSAFVAELWGVLEGLKYVRSRGFRKVELNIDSLTVVQVLKSGRLSSSGDRGRFYSKANLADASARVGSGGNTYV